MNNDKAMTCPDCGGEWSDGPRFCPLCGLQLLKLEDMKETEDSTGRKNDSGKLRYDLIPVWPLEQLAAVMTYGAKTYGNHNWRKGLKYSQLYAAAQRHVTAFWQGEDTDQDSGLPHLAHAAANMLMLLEFHHRGYDALGFDDRMREALSAAEIQALVQVSAA